MRSCIWLLVAWLSLSVFVTTTRGDPPRIKVGSIHIAGNDYASTREIERWMTVFDGSIRNDPFEEVEFHEDLRRILRFYRREGFLASEVRGSVDSVSTPPNRVALTVGIFEGPRAVLASAEFQLDESVAVDSAVASPQDPAAIAAHAIREAWTLAPGAPYCPREIAALRRELIGIAHGYGYADARLDVQVRFVEGMAPSRWHPTAVDLEALLVLGPRIRIGSVSIQGLVKTQPETVLRELTFHAGDLLLPAELDRSRKKLEQTRLYRSVVIAPEPPDPNAPERSWNQSPLEPSLKRVLVRIEDRKTGRFGTGIGYGSIDRAFIAATIEQENLRGRAIRVQLDGIYAERRRGVEGGAVFPWTFHRPIATRVELGYEKEEPRAFTAERLRAGLSFSRAISSSWKGEIGYRLERLDLLSGSVTEAVMRTKLGRIEVAVSRDTRRDLLFRPKGTFARISQEWFAPWLGSREHFGRHKVQLWAYRPIGPRFAIVIRNYAGWLQQQKGHAIPITERFFAGGTADLRGFPVDGIGPADSLGVPQGGRLLALGATELEILIRKPIYLSGFVDAGELENHREAFTWKRVSVGAGGGLLARSKLGVLRAEVGFPLTERFQEGPRFHFSTGTTFF